ncbi:hypothetical protein BST61_g9801 [Cercospora zeina]
MPDHNTMMIVSHGPVALFPLTGATIDSIGRLTDGSDSQTSKSLQHSSFGIQNLKDPHSAVISLSDCWRSVNDDFDRTTAVQCGLYRLVWSVRKYCIPGGKHAKHQVPTRRLQLVEQMLPIAGRVERV